MDKYKWDSPQEWLEDTAKEWDATRLYQELIALSRRLSLDDIQDEYQTEMDKDGYFDAQE